MIQRVAVLAYGAAAYLAFLLTLIYAIGFLAGAAVPKGVNDGSVLPVWQALLVDLALLAVFAVQHSVMARPWFKRHWTRVVSPAIERSTYVAAATGALALLLWQWRPIPGQVWTVHQSWARTSLWALYLTGWGILVLSTFMIGHFDLFGLRQVLARARERRYSEPGFGLPLFYRLVRHPIMTGFLVAFWAAPDMSTGRLLFVAGATGYIMVGVRLEEHDLAAQLGDPYQRYLEEVPRFVPRPSALANYRPGGHLADDGHPVVVGRKQV